MGVEADEHKISGVGLSGLDDWRSAAYVIQEKSGISLQDQVMIL